MKCSHVIWSAILPGRLTGIRTISPQEVYRRDLKWLQGSEYRSAGGRHTLKELLFGNLASHFSTSLGTPLSHAGAGDSSAINNVSEIPRSWCDGAKHWVAIFPLASGSRLLPLHKISLEQVIE
jgi:hypothetical protein